MKTNLSGPEAACAVLLAVAGVASAFYIHARDSTPKSGNLSEIHVKPVSDLARKPVHGLPPESPANTLSTSPITPLPANATAVPDEDLLKLSALVDLANARYERPDKARWAQAIPVAQNLLAGPCDCEQRNWLNQFVEMGNDALSDSTESYHEHASVMVTLGRNDQDAMAMSQRPN